MAINANAKINSLSIFSSEKNHLISDTICIFNFFDFSNALQIHFFNISTFDLLLFIFTCIV